MSFFKVTTNKNGNRKFGGYSKNEHDDRTDDRTDDRYSDRGRDRGDYQFGSYEQDNFGGRGRSNNSQDTFGVGGRSNRRGGHKSNRSRGGGKYNQGRGGRGGGGGVNPRSFLDDDDDMADTSNNFRQRSAGRYDPYSARNARQGGARGRDDGNNNRGGRGSNRGGSKHRSHNSQRSNLHAHQGWFKVVIPQGTKAGKNWVLKTLSENSAVPFVPNSYREEYNQSVFMIEDKHAAVALLDLSRKFEMPHNRQSMVVIVHTSKGPPTQKKLREEDQEKIKLVMSRRYDVAAKALNLDSFHTDDDFQRESLSVQLYRNDVMTAVCNIIKENIPELVTLSLKSNQIRNLESMRSLLSSAPNLAHLNLGDNEIRHQNELDHIASPTLQELVLDGNKLCDSIKDPAAYISVVRKRFPKVMKLDGDDLPPPISFDVESDVASSLPPVKGSFYTSEPTRNLLSLFLEQYYKLYDSHNRKDLIAAYHDHAIFTLTCTTHKAINIRGFFDDTQFKLSRNIKHRQDSGFLQERIRSGNLQVVSQLEKLPKTMHDPNAFVVDVAHDSTEMKTFVVSGIFKELGGKMEVIKAFSRTFVTVPQGQGLCIVNEQFSIMNATDEQKKSAFKTPAPTPSSSPVQSTSTAPAMPASAVIATGQLSIEQKQALVLKFSEASKMNLDWSQKCLEENQWNFEGAGAVFTDLHAQGKIPPEAFSG